MAVTAARLQDRMIRLARTKGVAVISAEDALSFGLSGPTLRGSGVDYDLRKYEPYSAYPKCEFSVPVGKNGDTYDRYWIRVQEIYESVKIIRQCLEPVSYTHLDVYKRQMFIGLQFNNHGFDLGMPRGGLNDFF